MQNRRVVQTVIVGVIQHVNTGKLYIKEGLKTEASIEMP